VSAAGVARKRNTTVQAAPEASSGDGEYSDSEELEENMAQEELWEAGARKRKSAVQAIPKAVKKVHVPFRPARAPTR